MSTYIQLDCLDCKCSLNFGKPIAKGNQLTLRLFSENKYKWYEGVECWQAVQVYLFRHINHHLALRSDDSSESQDFSAEAKTIEFDELLAQWNNNID